VYAFDQQDFAMLILDAEAKKEGGMSIAQDLRETRDGVPPIVFLTARAQDEWLATWASALASPAPSESPTPATDPGTQDAEPEPAPADNPVTDTGYEDSSDDEE